jgi:uncharacterized protein YbcI
MSEDARKNYELEKIRGIQKEINKILGKTIQNVSYELDWTNSLQVLIFKFSDGSSFRVSSSPVGMVEEDEVDSVLNVYFEKPRNPTT